MTKQYEVVGRRKVHGHEQGEVYEADYTPEQERRLVEGGHIRAVPKPPEKKEQ